MAFFVLSLFHSAIYVCGMDGKYDEIELLFIERQLEIHGEKIDFSVQTPANPSGITIPLPATGDSELSGSFPTKGRQRAMLLLRAASRDLSKDQLIEIAKSVK